MRSVQVAVALGSDVHLYNTEAGVASMLCSLAEDDYVTSLSWSADGRHLAIGTYSHQVRPRPAAKFKSLYLCGLTAIFSSISGSQQKCVTFYTTHPAAFDGERCLPQAEVNLTLSGAPPAGAAVGLQPREAGAHSAGAFRPRFCAGMEPVHPVYRRPGHLHPPPRRPV